MDITAITDLQQLKAMAYDQMVLLEQVQRNLAVINGRIAELQPATDTEEASNELTPAP